jgi:hypothetical protein
MTGIDAEDSTCLYRQESCARVRHANPGHGTGPTALIAMAKRSALKNLGRRIDSESGGAPHNMRKEIGHVILGCT